MEVDGCDYVIKCHKCQTYVDNVHVPPTPLNVMAAPWSFLMWGIDVIDPIKPKAPNEHCFILVSIGYFTKWVEAKSYASVTRNVVVKFIKRDLICKYDLPNHIIIDNETNLNNKMMEELCSQFKIQHRKSTTHRPKTNGAMIDMMLPFALHGYCTSIHTSTRPTLYSLVYGMEAVLPVEVEISLLRIQARYNQLNLIGEKRLTFFCHDQLYQKRMKKAFDKKVYPQEFQE
ncbi:putative protein K02A2.6, partial [Mucuna pruriens]